MAPSPPKQMQFLASLSKRYAPSLFPRIQPLLNSQTPPSPNPLNPNPISTFPPPNPPFTPQSVSQAISSHNADWQRAFEFFNWVETTHSFNHNIDTCNQMIDVLGKSFEFDLAWKLINKMKSHESTTPNHITFRILFKRYLAAHMVQQAIDCCTNCLAEFNLKDEISFYNLIDALCDHNHVAVAEELCKDHATGAGNIKLWNVILRGWYKMGWWSKCSECWEKMEMKGVQKDVHSYTMYMDVMCTSGKPLKTVTLYNEMKMKEIKLDAVAYNMVIRVVANSEGIDTALTVYGEMIEMGCKPNAATYNTLVKLLFQMKRFGHAYSMLGQMMENRCLPDVDTYHCIFSCSNKPNEMLKLFDRMVGCGVRPRMDTYVLLLTKFGRWGLLGPVFRVWKKMKEHGYSPDAFAYNILIDALIHKGLLDMARKYDEEMLAQGLSAKPREELETKPLGVLNEVIVPGVKTSEE